MHSSNQDFPLGKAHNHYAIAVCPVSFRYTLEIGCVQYLPYGFVLGIEFLRNDEQRTSEHLVPGLLRAYVHRLVVLGMSTDMHEPCVALSLIYKCADTLPKQRKPMRLNRLIHWTPVNLSRRPIFLDYESVARRSARPFSSLNGYGTVRNEDSFAIANCVLGKYGCSKTVVPFGFLKCFDYCFLPVEMFMKRMLSGLRIHDGITLFLYRPLSVTLGNLVA